MRIYIENLTFKCIIGILKFERIKKQKVVVNLSFDYKFSKNKFIDYAEIATLIETTMKEKKFLLIEDAILYFENYLLAKYNIKDLKIKISKPKIMKNSIVSLSNK